MKRKKTEKRHANNWTSQIRNWSANISTTKLVSACESAPKKKDKFEEKNQHFSNSLESKASVEREEIKYLLRTDLMGRSQISGSVWSTDNIKLLLNENYPPVLWGRLYFALVCVLFALYAFVCSRGSVMFFGDLVKSGILRSIFAPKICSFCYCSMGVFYSGKIAGKKADIKNIIKENRSV